MQEVVDLEKLEDPVIKDQYRLELENKFEVLLALEEEITPDEFWMSVKDTFLDTANNVLGRKRKRKDKPWISQDTLKLMDVRRSLKKHKSHTPEVLI